MKDKDLAIVFDCGATSIRVIAMDVKGKICAVKALPNETNEDPNLKNGRIWDIEKIWGKFKTSAQSVTSEIDTSRIAGVTITTFGVDGGVVDKNGELIYPVISWQCNRTQPIMKAIDKYIPLEKLYNINGNYP